MGHGELFKIFDNTEQTCMQIAIDLASKVAELLIVVGILPTGNVLLK